MDILHADQQICLPSLEKMMILMLTLAAADTSESPEVQVDLYHWAPGETP